MSDYVFARECYLRNGWLALPELARSVEVGDVLQIGPGKVASLLSLPAIQLAQAAQISPATALSSYDFQMKNGVSIKNFQRCRYEHDAGQCFSRYEVDFAWAGSYVFQCQQVQAQFLLNWHQLRDDFLLKLSQLHFQFRDAYVVTAVAQASQWNLSIAATAGANLHYTTASQSQDLFISLACPELQFEASRGLAVQQSSVHQPAHFIQAKRMILSEAARDKMLQQVLERQLGISPLARANWLQADWVNLLKNPELSLNTCKDIFSWRDLNLDDIELLSQ